MEAVQLRAPAGDRIDLVTLRNKVTEPMPQGPKQLWIRQVALAPVVRRLTPVLYWMAFLWRRLLFRTTFIAITGSMGKTTAKECLGRILSSAAPTFRSPRNAGGGTLVLLNILRVRPWHRYAVIEVAVAGPGKMQWPARLVRPDVAVVLNVMSSHITAYRDRDEIAREKAILLQHLRPGGVALLNRDDERAARMVAPAGCEVRYFGSTGDCDYQAEQPTAVWPQPLCFNLRTHSGQQAIRTQLVGIHWTQACLAAIAAADSAGVTPDRSAAILKNAPPFPGRLAPFRLPNGAIVLRDDYSGSIDGVEAALRVMDDAVAERRLFVMTDFSYFDGHRVKRLRYIANRAARGVDVLVLVGSKAEYGSRRAVEAGVKPENAHGFATLKQAAEFLRQELREGDLVLIKGRTTDHTTRLFMAQLGPVKCWEEYCPKRMLCDICWELGLSGKQLRGAERVHHEWD
jgi:UDP-N-acetylmuramoyl-tripeptide--D-alanyl-D-alanine ligase